MEIKNMSTEELEALRALITEELVVRKDKEEKKLWENVRKAIKEYCRSAGRVVIEIIGQNCTIELDGTEDFSEIGRIIVPDEY